jgi:hypothetical protein
MLQAEGFSERVIKLAIENDAHSDDELQVTPQEEDGAEPVAGPSALPALPPELYFIKEKTGRSEKVKNFFHLLDDKRRQYSKIKKVHHRLAIFILFAPLIFH